MDSNFWCQTDGDQLTSGNGRNKSILVWKINDFLDREEDQGEFICSKMFKVYGPNDVDTKWKMKVFPYGTKSCKPNHFSVCFQSENDFNVNANIKIFVGGKERAFISENQLIRPGGFWMAHYHLDVLIGLNLLLKCEIFVMKTDYNVKMFHDSQMMADLEEAFNLKDTLGLDVIVKCGDASFECSKFMLTRVATKIFEGFGEAHFKEFIIGREPVSIVHNTRPGSSIKWPTPN